MIAAEEKIMTTTVYISLIVQFLTLLFTFRGIFYKLAPQHKPLTQIIVIENIVQIVEGMFYILIALTLSKIQLSVVTYYRYFDWVITTPIMLISTVIYFVYTQRLRDKQEPFSIQKLWTTHSKTILKIVLYNFGMLVCGFIGEIGLVSKAISVPVGFVFFALVFREIYLSFEVANIRENSRLFYFFVIVWGLYGVAALLPDAAKNISYNMLDIIAKNFYGIFIFYKIVQAYHFPIRVE